MRGMHALKHLVLVLVYGTLGLLAGVLAAYGWHLSLLPDPKIWHTARLASEFRESDASRVKTLDEYRALEDRLFAELKKKVYERVGDEAGVEQAKGVRPDHEEASSRGNHGTKALVDC